MFDWQDLYYFTVLARTQSLSAAARELQVEHATVGRRVDALEKALGVKLVDRLPRSRPLTAQGLALAQVAAGMGDMATQVMRLSRVASIELAGTVRVSCPPSIANHCIAPQLARLRARYPQLNLVLMPSTQLAALDKGEADIALRTVRPDEAALVRRKVGVVRFGLYAAPALEHLPAAQWTFIAYDASRDHLPQQAWLHQLRGPRPIVFAASELITQQMAARAQVGAVVLPTLVGDHDPLLTRLPTPSDGPVRDIWLTVYPDMRRSPSVKVVMEFLVECIEAQAQLRR
ncbi:LysR family transcriptional regulator [Pseudomonas sp. PA-6-1D]|uniref:LysR family transcriptional regulator n=1 Tax=Pseudomonas TaxID=286 RepID=UPI001EEF7D4D|nr:MULTISPECIES: LysR family transcriptional regulator [Pseudomonas]MCF5143950.1 LysR family transcriptional regulator [Pseudomonas sp. PA-6-3C]MCF5150339.1 LysR family transcriptional regulator [Pseudomonas sp. PA-6-3F]MCF5162121.1 LysR family transcriptional regulator [Pseudomonas sp. PA-6-2E]MCF5175347.1 LysR family transcriptional regulator [Pseudomonas sp. PA-6-1D]MCF5195596.1 LysR family transcriptional regulator [Pseudomonas sp. PA-6-1H]